MAIEKGVIYSASGMLVKRDLFPLNPPITFQNPYNLVLVDGMAVTMADDEPYTILSIIEPCFINGCCINDLGLFPHNEDLNIGAYADVTGNWKAVLTFGSAKITRTFPAIDTEPIIIPRPFNEVYQYNLTILRPDGSVFEFNTCPNFTFRTYINIDRTCETPCP